MQYKNSCKEELSATIKIKLLRWHKKKFEFYSMCLIDRIQL